MPQWPPTWWEWETELVENLFDLLYSNFPSTQRENRLPWTLKNGKCDVKSYDELRSSRNIPLWQSIWGARAPCKITFFTWTPALCTILTIGNLWKRHMVIWVGVVLIRTWRDSGHLLPFCFLFFGVFFI